MLTFSDLFCGVGGFRLAFGREGYSCVLSCESDERCQDVYEANHGDRPFGDVFDLTAQVIPLHDVCTAGIPCQPFSKSGKMLGFKDERSNAFNGLLRVVQMGRPSVVVIENVQGLKEHDGGRTIKVMVKCLEGLGYQVSWSLLNAIEFGGRQNRSRVFVVASTAGVFDFARMGRTVSGAMSDILDPTADGWLDPSEYTLLEKTTVRPRTGAVFAGYRNKRLRVVGANPASCASHSQQNRIYSATGTSQTLSSQLSGRFFVEIGGKVRRLTRLECARLQGFPDDFVWAHQGRFYQQCGNSVHVPMVQALARDIRVQLLSGKAVA